MEGLPNFEQESKKIEQYKARFFELKERVESLKNERSKLQKEGLRKNKIKQLNFRIEGLEDEKSIIVIELRKRLLPV